MDLTRYGVIRHSPENQKFFWDNGSAIQEVPITYGYRHDLTITVNDSIVIPRDAVAPLKATPLLFEHHIFLNLDMLDGSTIQCELTDVDLIANKLELKQCIVANEDNVGQTIFGGGSYQPRVLSFGMYLASGLGDFGLRVSQQRKEFKSVNLMNKFNDAPPHNWLTLHDLYDMTFASGFLKHSNTANVPYGPDECPTNRVIHSTGILDPEQIKNGFPLDKVVLGNFIAIGNQGQPGVDDNVPVPEEYFFNRVISMSIHSTNLQIDQIRLEVDAFACISHKSAQVQIYP